MGWFFFCLFPWWIPNKNWRVFFKAPCAASEHQWVDSSVTWECTVTAQREIYAFFLRLIFRSQSASLWCENELKKKRNNTKKNKINKRQHGRKSLLGNVQHDCHIPEVRWHCLLHAGVWNIYLVCRFTFSPLFFPPRLIRRICWSQSTKN